MTRLDNFLVENAFIDSRNKAQALIKNGVVSVNDKVILKSAFKVEESDDKKILSINGELTIQNAAELQKVLIECLEETAHLTLNLENVTEMDMSCLQLLCSAHKTTVKADKHFSIDGRASSFFQEAVNVSGYQQFTGCELDKNSSCLWVDGNDE